MIRATLDACVSVPYFLAEHLLTLAEQGCYQPLWSAEILDETRRNLVKVAAVPEQAARRRVEVMRHAFPEAEVPIGDVTIPLGAGDVDDEHVVAAAIAGQATHLVTANLADFDAALIGAAGVSVIHPDRFLTSLLRDSALDALEALRSQADRYRNPPLTTLDLCRGLARTVPRYANLVARVSGSSQLDLAEPQFVYSDDYGDWIGRIEGPTPDLTDPFVVGFLWWSALLNRAEFPDAAANLSCDPRAWGDFGEVAAMLGSASLSSGVDYAIDAPDDIAFLKVVEEMPEAKVFHAGVIDSPALMILVRVDDGTWRVWGVGPHLPTSAEILS